MASSPIDFDSSDRPRGRPASTAESRNNQLTALAVDLAERQLIAGTASAQVITHYLKESSLKTQLELEKLRRENSLLSAKEGQLASASSAEALYKEALEAMRSYTGQDDDDE
jgi:hypothetical protein